MRVVLITQNDVFYLPASIDHLLEHFPSHSQVVGAVVTDVSPDGPAYNRLAGPDQGGPDIILKVNGMPTRTRAEFRAALKNVKPGGIVTLQVYNVRAQAGQVVRIKLR